MPYGSYRKTYRPRKRTNRRRPATPWYDRKYSTTDIAKSALSTARYVKSLLNVEYKLHDTINDSLSVSNSTFSVNILTGIDQGDSAQTRDGHTVKMKSLAVKGHLQLNDGLTGDIVRVMLIKSYDPDAPTSSAIFDTQTAGRMVYSLRNINGTSLYKVLYDKVFALNSGSRTHIPFQIYSNKDTKLKWDLGTNTEKYGAHYLCFISQNEANTTVEYQSRVRFIDN